VHKAKGTLTELLDKPENLLFKMEADEMLRLQHPKAIQDN